MPPRRRQKIASPLSLEPNLISLQHFPQRFGLRLNTKEYNARELARWLKAGGRAVPHTRRPLTTQEINAIMLLTGHKRLGPLFATKSELTAYRKRQAREKLMKRGQPIIGPAPRPPRTPQRPPNPTSRRLVRTNALPERRRLF